MIPIIFAMAYLANMQPLLTASIPCGLLPQDVATNLANNESWYCPISEQITNQWESWLPVMLVATILAFLLAAIIFMAGVALQLPKVRNFGASEFFQATATAIIVVAFVYVSAVLFGLTPGSFVGGINPYATSFNLISSTIASAQNLYTSIYNVYLPLAESTSVSIDVGGPAAGLRSTSALAISGESIAAGGQTIVGAYSALVSLLFLDPATALAQILTEGITVLYGEYYLLVFFSVAAIPVFIIPGIIFRAILPLRGLGGVMIAMGVGFYLVMPTLFATAYYFTTPGVLANLRLANGQFASLNNRNVNSQAISPSSPVVLYLQSSQSSLNGFWMMIIFYPAMIISFTYAFIVQFADLIGGTYKATNRLRGFL